jgi:hypothetical protein
MTTVRATKGYARRLVLGALLAAAATYTEAELKAICERRGGWWRGNLIPGYCEYQTAFSQSP